MLEEVLPNDALKIVVRGDTLGLLAEIIQDFVVTKLEKSILIAIHAANKYGPDHYPYVDEAELQMIDFLAGTPLDAHHRLYGHEELRVNEIAHIKNSLLTDKLRAKIVRKLAYRAGVVKLSGGAFCAIWEDVVNLLLIFLQDAVCKAKLCRIVDQAIKGEEIDMFRDVPPEQALEPATGERCGLIERYLIPAFVQDKAMAMGLPAVYGDTWVAVDDKTIKEEKAEALLRYRIKPERGSDWEDDQSQSTDEESQYEESEDEFSVYDDEKCMDIDDD